MIYNKSSWEKLGRILEPSTNIYWMVTHTGPSFGLSIDDNDNLSMLVTGRDRGNRSLIGNVTVNIRNPNKHPIIDETPVFSFGERGTFDENGVSYPCLVVNGADLYMYYVGWMPTVLTPFQNNTGLAKSTDEGKSYQRVSRAPILPLIDEEPFSSGSVFVMRDKDLWKMWYTSFLRWGNSTDDHKHYYVIKYAESVSGVEWNRTGKICIDIQNSGEYAIGKPSVIKDDDGYHMWYVYRGLEYRIGYAHSKDGINWCRRDDLVGIGVSDSGWDSIAISYPHVFRHGDHLYMLYCGNDYGREGLGLARKKL